MTLRTARIQKLCALTGVLTLFGSALLLCRAIFVWPPTMHVNWMSEEDAELLGLRAASVESWTSRCWGIVAGLYLVPCRECSSRKRRQSGGGDSSQSTSNDVDEDDSSSGSSAIPVAQNGTLEKADNDSDSSNSTTESSRPAGHHFTVLEIAGVAVGSFLAGGLFMMAILKLCPCCQKENFDPQSRRKDVSVVMYNRATNQVTIQNRGVEKKDKSVSKKERLSWTSSKSHKGEIEEDNVSLPPGVLPGDKGVSLSTSPQVKSEAAGQFIPEPSEIRRPTTNTIDDPLREAGIQSFLLERSINEVDGLGDMNKRNSPYNSSQLRRISSRASGGFFVPESTDPLLESTRSLHAVSSHILDTHSSGSIHDPGSSSTLSVPGLRSPPYESLRTSGSGSDFEKRLMPVSLPEGSVLPSNQSFDEDLEHELLEVAPPKIVPFSSRVMLHSVTTPQFQNFPNDQSAETIIQEPDPGSEVWQNFSPQPSSLGHLNRSPLPQIETRERRDLFLQQHGSKSIDTDSDQDTVPQPREGAFKTGFSHRRYQ